MARKRGPISLGAIFGKPYKGIISVNLDNWIRRIGNWRLKESLPVIDSLIAQIETHTNYLNGFNKALLECEKSHFIDESDRLATRAKYYKYRKGIELASKVIAKQLKELVER